MKPSTAYTAASLAPLLRRRRIDPLPRAHILLRRTPRRRPTRQPPQRLVRTLEVHRREQVVAERDCDTYVSFLCSTLRGEMVCADDVVECVYEVFMNKADLLEKKLKSGVKVNKYIPRYGERENTIAVFSRCACRRAHSSHSFVPSTVNCISRVFFLG